MSTRGERLPAPDDTLAIALSLAKAGWPVFPVTIYADGGKRHKVPAVPRGTSWTEWATTDAEKIVTAWTGDNAGCWIGVYVAAAGLVVLDVDKKPDNGAAFLKAADLTPPKTLNYKTLGGGKHYLYRAPKDMALTNAQGLMYNGERLKGCDVRGGNGLFVYYGPELNPIADHRYDSSNPDAVKAYSERTRDDYGIADAPDWILVPATPKSADRAADADTEAFVARLIDGKPDKAVKAALANVKPKGMSHGDMLESVTELVQLGRNGHRGVAIALDVARETYSRDWPDAARHWDNAVTGSIKRIGLPPATIEISKAERKAIKQRLKPEAVERANQAVADGKLERKAEFIKGKIELGEGQLTDAALSEKIAADLMGSWANARGIGLLRYNGLVWEGAEDEDLTETVRQILRDVRAHETFLAIQRGDKKHEDEAKQLEGRSRVVNVARFVAGILAQSTPPLDAHPDLVNVQNGVVDLRTKELLPHDPRYMFTKVAGAEYDPAADGTLWKVALKALPKSVRPWLQVRFGQALTGYTPDDAVMPIFEGGGENGKSTIFDALRKASGNYAITVSKRLLTSNPGDHPTELTDLMGVRMAFAEELEGRTLDVSRLKDVLGTAQITARRMRENNITWDATHAIFTNTNNRLGVAETDHGTWRRLALVLFPYKFVKAAEATGAANERPGDPRLKSYFEQNADPAVLSWLVEGAYRWYANGKMMPPLPKKIVNDTLDWRSDADPVMGYVRDRLEVAEGYAIASADLTTDFNGYLLSRGNKEWNEATIGSRFRGHVELPNVEKKAVRFGAIKPSRPPFTVRPLPAVSKAWVGVRFREDDHIPSEAEQDAVAFDDIVKRAKK